MVACGVLEHSGKPPFHLCALHIPAYLPHFVPLTQTCLYLFIYLFPRALSLLLLRSTARWATALISPTTCVLWTWHGRGKAARLKQLNHLWWSVYCPAPICRSSQCNITPVVHNTKHLSWGQDCCLGLLAGSFFQAKLWHFCNISCSPCVCKERTKPLKEC